MSTSAKLEEQQRNNAKSEEVELKISDFPVRLKRSEKSVLELDLTRLFVNLQPKKLPEKVKVQDYIQGLDSSLQTLGFKFDSLPEKIPSYQKRINRTLQNFWLCTLNDSMITQELLTALVKLLGPNLNWIGGVYRVSGTKECNGLACPLPKILLVKPREGINEEEFNSVLGEFQLKQDPELSKYLAGYRNCFLDGTIGKNVYALRDELLKNKGVIQDVSYAWMPFQVSLGANGGGGNPSLLWNLNKIGATSVSVPTPVSTRKVVVAVIDEGCDLTHPELKDFYWPHQDATKPPGATIDFTSEPTAAKVIDGGGAMGTTHGTQCAGVIRSIHHAVTTRGFPGNYFILPIRLVAWRPDLAAAAIGYAVQAGARVINMSFGGNDGSGDFYDDPLMDKAIQNAEDKDVVICAATMNDNQKLIYHPAAHPLVMACGASNPNDERCTNGDWGGSYGSNFGEELNVVAPGVGISTTTGNSMMGTATMMSNWWGTSAATPHVTAVAAILIQEHPALTAREVRDIIQNSADPVPVGGRYNYNANPARPGWNEEMGYGRINLTNALIALRNRRGSPSGGATGGTAVI